MSSNAFFSDLLASISERGRTLLRPRRAAGRETGRLRAARIVRGAAVGPRRGFRRRDRARGARPLSSSRRGRPADVLRDAGARLRSGPRAAVAGDRGLARAAVRRGRQRPAFCLRAAAAGTDPAAEPRARRHQRAGGAARRSAPAHERKRPQGSGRARPRRRASFVFMVQQGISRAAQDRLADASEHSGTDHPLRGGARDPRLGRSAPPHRSGRPALLRLLSSRAGRRAPDLRRGGADRNDPRRDRAAARRRPRRWCRSSAPAPRCSIRSPTPSAASAAFRSAVS